MARKPVRKPVKMALPPPARKRGKAIAKRAWETQARIEIAARKRDQIMQGALRVFLQYGYEGTSMDRVASEAGVSKPTIYNHFKDKEGLFASLVEYVVVERFLSGSPDLDEKLASADAGAISKGLFGNCLLSQSINSSNPVRSNSSP